MSKQRPVGLTISRSRVPNLFKSLPAIVNSQISRLEAAISVDTQVEPQRIIDGYTVRAHRLEPVGLVYLWPETN